MSVVISGLSFPAIYDRDQGTAQHAGRPLHIKDSRLVVAMNGPQIPLINWSLSPLTGDFSRLSHQKHWQLSWQILLMLSQALCIQ
jgi:hypothetical protein